MTTSDTSHDVPTPPQPRPGDTGTEAGMQPPTGLAEQPGGQENVPGGIGNVLASMGLRPWNALYIAAAVTFVFGLIVLVWPGATLVVLAVLFGCYMVISGILGLVEGLSDHHEDGFTRASYIVLGVLGIVLGLFCLRRIDVTVLVLAFLLSVFWIMRGVLDLSIASVGRVPGSQFGHDCTARGVSRTCGGWLGWVARERGLRDR